MSKMTRVREYYVSLYVCMSVVRVFVCVPVVLGMITTTSSEQTTKQTRLTAIVNCAVDSVDRTKWETNREGLFSTREATCIFPVGSILQQKQ